MKTNSIIIAFMTVSCFLTSCKNDAVKKEVLANDIISRNYIEVSDGIMTPEALYSFGRVGAPAVSPDGKQILYPVTFIGIKENKSNTELFLMNKEGAEAKQITQTPNSESNAVWKNDGKSIAFLAKDKDGKMQVFEIESNGGNLKQITSYNGYILGFIFSPDGKKIAFYSEIKLKKNSSEIHEDLPQASGRVIDSLMYKHWDEWIETIPHIFVADYTADGLKNITDILDGEPFEAPMKPDGGTESFCWHPDSKKVAYVSRKKTGKEYALSTNSDIYLYDLETKKTENLTDGMMGYDRQPKFSPDGKSIAWTSMERDGYESDIIRLFVMNMDSKDKQFLTTDFDYNVDDFDWDSDSQRLYYVACVKGTTQLFSIDFKKNIEKLTEGYHDYASVSYFDGKLYALRHSLSYPNEIFSVDIASKESKQLTSENKHILDQIEMGKVEERWIKTTDDKEMLTWIVYPPKFDKNKKYPAILYCQGGPQSTISQFWSYRWNLQMMAANGYIIVAPNRRGVPGFGQAWNEQISGDYGGQNMKDYLSAIDALCMEPFIDKTRLGCTGASYGGYSVYWLAGNHNKRFKAFLAHAGIFNLEAQYLETEEMWFANWD